MHAYYVELNHGALVVLAPSWKLAREKARAWSRTTGRDDIMSISRMPDTTYVDDDAGFEWHDPWSA